jgi:hypothetical protein
MTATAKQPETQPRFEFVPFYIIDEDKNGKRVPKINPLKVRDSYRELGFRRYDLGDRSFLIKIEDNVIEQATDTKLLDDFEDYYNSFGDNLPDGTMTDAVMNKYYHQMAKYTAPKFINRIGPEPEMEIQEHTRNKGYIYYRNGFVEITAKGYELKPYSQLTGKVWKDQILDRDFKPVSDFEKSNFAQFVRNISNAWETRFYDGAKNPNPSEERYRQFKQMIGNGLHSYVEGKMRCIILTDSRDSDDASGRTGKTLILKAMGHMLNANRFSKTYGEINGKDFDMEYKFKWQELSLDSKLVHINDAARNFPFESLYNDITEGIRCQKKNETPFLIRPKIYITTNRTIRLHGESSKDRSMEFETADYYRADYGPDVEYGEWFFTDWDDKAWNHFDNYMIHCLQLYLKNGLEKPESLNLDNRKMREETSEEWCSFMSDRWKGYTTEVDQKKLLEEFQAYYVDAHKFRSPQRTVNKWFVLYGEYHPEIIRGEKRKSNGTILLSYKPKPGVDITPDEADDWLED